ncbi:MAG TPA: hypothetical protein VFV38_07030 [Ktedonobacteraceae bacterium]|nr:hypothetical protein [Ktedonobacteraceae bacterium]
MNTIHDLHLQGKSVQDIALTLRISRTTVRKYLKNPEAVLAKPRPPRPSKLDPFKEQLTTWVMEDHCSNCEVLLERIRKQGYTGGITLVKNFVQPLRPAISGHVPVQRYESKPGEQLQFDWGEFAYEHEGKNRNSMDLWRCWAILGCAMSRWSSAVTLPHSFAA